MASKSPQTMAKRAREQAVKEKRERKQARKAARKAEAAAERAGGDQQPLDVEDGVDNAPHAGSDEPAPETAQTE